MQTLYFRLLLKHIEVFNLYGNYQNSCLTAIFLVTFVIYLSQIFNKNQKFR